MTDDETQQTLSEEQPSEAAPQGGAGPGAGAEASAQEAPSAGAEPLSEAPVPEPSPSEAPDPAAAELAAAKERYLRLLADFDNMRKRQARELEERTARANERLLGALIPVFDQFEMALAAAREESPFVQGVRMIAECFRKALEQSGAEVLDAPEGTVFDPMAHEALSMAPHPTVPQGCVASQFRKGWRLGGKVLRPAQVIVSSGAPEAPADTVGKEA